MEVINTIGRRKNAIARIYMRKGKGDIIINDKDYKVYFPTGTLQYKINQPFSIINVADQYDVKATVNGGGVSGQAEAVRLAIARALCEVNIENKTILRAENLLTRDPRMVERKKPGQKKARKKFQFSKR